MITIWARAFRNQLLEVHFDVTQGCFLGQLVGSETILMFARRAIDET